jgi:hypothetical protein
MVGSLPLRVGFRRVGAVCFCFSWLVPILFCTGSWAQDCDGNGISDPIQIAASPELDCNANGILDLCETGGYVSPPVEQDICELAQWICPGEAYDGSTLAALNEGGISGSCGGANTAADVWYVYVPMKNGTVSISTCGSPWPNYDTVLAVFDGCPNAGGVQLVCAAGGCDSGGRLSHIRNLNVTAGWEYYIRVTGRNGAVGEFQIRLSGPRCLTQDCNQDSVVDECGPPQSSAPGVLCYDDGDGSADMIVSESFPASFVVKFSVPSTFTGLKQVARITWYAGSGPIENPKAVVRRDLSGGFGTSQDCIVQDITEVAPNTFNEVSLGQNPKEFLVQGGEDIYAGVYGAKMSLGADAETTSLVMTAMAQHFWTCPWGEYPDVPWPVLDPGISIPCWARRNYKLIQAGVHYPADFVNVIPTGEVSCQLQTDSWCRTWSTCTPSGSCYSTWTCSTDCTFWCSRDFKILGYNWLIRAKLAGTCSPELTSGCHDRTIS